MVSKQDAVKKHHVSPAKTRVAGTDTVPSVPEGCYPELQAMMRPSRSGLHDMPFSLLCKPLPHLSSCPSTIFRFMFCLWATELGSAKVYAWLCLHAVLSASPCAASLDLHDSKPTCNSTAAHHGLAKARILLLLLQ